MSSLKVAHPEVKRKINGRILTRASSKWNVPNQTHKKSSEPRMMKWPFKAEFFQVDLNPEIEP
jgi:hypothetical protein